MSFSRRFEEALVFASQLHAAQHRKGTTIPYVSHLLAVASIVLEHGGDEDQAVAALLHDAVEDQGGAKTREEIRRRFGDGVAAIIDGCTEAEVVPKPPWKERKEQYVAQIRGASFPVLLVSAADKLHNARSILADLSALGDGLWSRFNGGKEGTLWYYTSLVKEFKSMATDARLRALIEELERVVDEIHRLASR